MTDAAPAPRPSIRRLVALFGGLAIALAACGTTTPTDSPAASPTPAAPTASPQDPGTTDGLPLQTETEWGTIWDDVPASFPRYPGSVREEPDEPASARFVMAAGAQAVATRMQVALESAGYSTEAMSGPFEDGSFVIDSIGTSAECRAQTRIEPAGGTTRMTVLYGAGCPFD